MRISDWSSDVCSSDLLGGENTVCFVAWDGWQRLRIDHRLDIILGDLHVRRRCIGRRLEKGFGLGRLPLRLVRALLQVNQSTDNTGSARRFGIRGIPQRTLFRSSLAPAVGDVVHAARSEEHTSELQSLMRISYAVFCWKKKKNKLVKV